MGTVIVLIVLGILVGLSVRTMVKDRRNGRSCSCGCDGYRMFLWKKRP